MAGHDIFLVFVEGRDGSRDEYAKWFATSHMSDMCQLPGVISANAFRLASLEGGSVPAQLCAIYETGDGTAILDTIAAAKGTAALPISDIQGPMTWRVLEGVRVWQRPPVSAPGSELICMFGGPWDDLAEQRIWEWLCSIRTSFRAIRQTRLSPVQPSRGSEYSAVLFLSINEHSDADHLARAIADKRAAPFAKFLLATPWAGQP